MEKISLRALRINAGYTLDGASAKIGVSRDTLSNYERGISRPNNDIIDKLLALYGVKYENVDWGRLVTV